MKAIRFMRPEVIEYSDIPNPVPGEDEILARVEYAGFCATDIELLTGEMVHIKKPFLLQRPVLEISHDRVKLRNGMVS